MTKKLDIYNVHGISTRKLKNTTGKILIYAFLIVMSVCWILPFVYLIIQSFAQNNKAAVNIYKKRKKEKNFKNLDKKKITRHPPPHHTPKPQPPPPPKKKKKTLSHKN